MTIFFFKKKISNLKENQLLQNLKMTMSCKIWRTKVKSQIWKYFRLKRYHWFLTTLELFIPTTLFVALLLNRVTTVPKYIEPCSFDEYYLPSAGMSLWLQSLLCNSVNRLYSRYPDYSACHEKSHKFRPLCPIDNEKSFDCFLDWYSDNYDNLTENNKSSNVAAGDVVHDICGITEIKGIGGNVTAEDEKSAAKKRRIKKRRYKKDSLISKRCNNLMMEMFYENPSLWILADMHKEVLFGKILYTPDDVRANTIVEDANENNFGEFIEQKSKLEENNRTGFTDVLLFIDCMALEKFEVAKNEVEMLKRAKMLNDQRHLLAAVTFHFDKRSRRLPLYLNYTIRTKADFTDHKKYTEPLDYTPTQPETKTAIFLAVQDMIDDAFMRLTTYAGKLKTEDSYSDFAVTLQQMPQNCDMENKFFLLVRLILPFFMVIAFLLPFGLLVSQIVQEKEDGMKEFMLIMSMDHCSYWMSWFISSLLWWIFLSFAIHVVLVFVLQGFADVSLLFFFTFIYMITCIPQAFLVSCFIYSATSATAVSGLLYFLLYYAQNFVLDSELDSWIKLTAVSIVPQIGFAKGIEIIMRIRDRGSNASWIDLMSDRGGGQSLFLILMVLCLDMIMYCLLTVYIDAVWPGKHGVGKRCCFCFSMCLNSKSRSSSKNSGDNNNCSGVKLCEVSKIFKTEAERLIAVNNVSLQFCSNEISVILGQNGAGKTTLFSLIVGTQVATSGSIFVQGKDVALDTNEARKTMGFCSQDDTLFHDLTVREHIWFFTTLKTGIPPNDNEINELLCKSKFQEFEHKTAKVLSGGTKRKLSICLAFCGSTQVILLDEPTSGVDPSSRRAIWRVLNEFKEGRTIIMSTHFMEEADEIGDKIAILSFGNVLAFDSSVGLKQRFAKFYKLVVASNDIDTLQWIYQQIWTIYEEELYINQGVEETEYILPHKDVWDFEKLITVVRTLEVLPNFVYGIKSSGMEDVFVACIGDRVQPGTFGDVEQLLKPPISKSRAQLWKQHAYALLAKRLQHAKRDYWNLFTQIFIPVFYILFTMSAQVRRYETPEDFPLQEISPKVFQSHRKSLQLPYINRFSHSPDSLTYELRQFENGLFKSSGLGSVCGTKRNHSLDERICQSAPRQLDLGKLQSASNWTSGCNCCRCVAGTQVCDTERNKQYVASFPSVRIASGETLLNTSGQSMEYYFINTDRETFSTRFAGLEITSADIPYNYSSKYYSHLFVDFVLRIWFDGRASNSGPAYLNAINNNILRSGCSGTRKQCGITTLSHPLSGSLDKQRISESAAFYRAFSTAVIMLISLTAVSTSWVVLYVEENTSKLKRVQYLEGLSPITYWTVGLLLETLIYLFVGNLLLLILVIFKVIPYGQRGNEKYVVALITFFGIANVPLSGSMSHYAKNGTYVFLVMVLLLVCGLGLGFYVMYSEMMESQVAFSPLFMILPHYCFMVGMWEIAYTDIINSVLKDLGNEVSGNLNDWSKLGKYYFAMSLTGFIAYFLLLSFDIGWGTHFRRETDQVSHGEVPAGLQDDDVAWEQKRIYDMNNVIGSTDALVVKDLTKVYQKPCACKIPKVAVDGITFGVKKQTCFGLLGMNGAGKTTVLKMLTGQIMPSGGKILLQKQDQEKQKIGYCPQFDTHDPLLTPKEMLTFHCRLHGYLEEDIPGLVNSVCKTLDLLIYKDVICSKLSGGTTRRLSAGIAFLGAPQLILLDEPSTGLDPVSRKLVWDLVKNSAYIGQSIILVSHVMEECEALCDIIGILINGKFVCMGSPQHLKNKYGNEYVIKVDKRILGEVSELLEWVRYYFPTALILEETISTLQFSVNLSDVWLSYIFDTLKELQPVDDSGTICYTVSQITLHDVFLRFAGEQESRETSY